MESGYKFCVKCGNTQGFPEFENQEPTAQTCENCQDDTSLKLYKETFSLTDNEFEKIRVKQIPTSSDSESN